PAAMPAPTTDSFDAPPPTGIHDRAAVLSGMASSSSRYSADPFDAEALLALDPAAVDTNARVMAHLVLATDADRAGSRARAVIDAVERLAEADARTAALVDFRRAIRLNDASAAKSAAMEVGLEGRARDAFAAALDARTGLSAKTTLQDRALQAVSKQAQS